MICAHGDDRCAKDTVFPSFFACWMTSVFDVAFLSSKAESFSNCSCFVRFGFGIWCHHSVLNWEKLVCQATVNVSHMSFFADVIFVFSLSVFYRKKESDDSKLASVMVPREYGRPRPSSVTMHGMARAMPFSSFIHSLLTARLWLLVFSWLFEQRSAHV